MAAALVLFFFVFGARRGWLMRVLVASSEIDFSDLTLSLGVRGTFLGDRADLRGVPDWGRGEEQWSGGEEGHC